MNPNSIELTTRELAEKRSGKQILMVVNNLGSNDYRVVKSAEAVVRSGYSCTVLGVLKNGFAEDEVINGVRYRRVRLPVGPKCIIAGMLLTHGWLRWLHNATKKARKLLRGRMEKATGWLRNEEPSRLLSEEVSPPALQYAVQTAERNPSASDGEHTSFLKKSELKLWRNRPMICASLRRRICRCLGHLVSAHDTLLVRYKLGFGTVLKSLRFDLIHCHELWPLPACASVAGKSGRALLYDSHELEAYRNTHWSKRIMRQRQNLERRLIRDVDAVFTVSPGCAETLKELYGLSDVQILRNVPLRNQADGGRSLRCEINLSDEQPLLVYVGSVTFNRGVEIALEALSLLPGYNLATVGPIKPDVQDAMKREAEKFGVSQRFHIQEKVAPDVLISYISSADVSLMPIQNACRSYYHCLPNKLFESMFAGVPVAASDFPDMRQVIERWEVGRVFDETDARSIAEHVCSVYENRTSFYSPDKIERIRSELCFENEVKKLIEAYDSMLGCHSGSQETDAFVPDAQQASVVPA